MPRTYIFHPRNNPSVKIPMELMSVDDWTPNVGKSFFVAHNLYMKNGKLAHVVIDSVYPEDGEDCMPIAVCHRIDDNGVQEKIEVGCELLFETEVVKKNEKNEKKRKKSGDPLDRNRAFVVSYFSLAGRCPAGDVL